MESWRKRAFRFWWRDRESNRMHDLIRDIGDFIFVEDQPVSADAIMVLGGSFPEAAELAADLWKQGLAPTIIIGGGVSIKTGKFPGPRSKQDKYNKVYKTEYEFFQDVLRLNGVPDSAIFGENRSSYTRENALFARETADGLGMKIQTAMLICKAFHARRSLMFYQAAFPETTFHVIPYDGHNVSKENWFLSDYGMERVFGELKRCGEQVHSGDIHSYRNKGKAAFQE